MFYAQTIPTSNKNNKNISHSVSSISKEMFDKVITGLNQNSNLRDIFKNVIQHLFDLRMMMSFNADINEEWVNYIKNLQEKIKETFSNGNYYDLNTELIEVYTEYFKIVKTLAKNNKGNFSIDTKQSKVDDVRNFIGIVTVEKKEALIALFDNSLLLEFLLMIANTLNNGTVKKDSKFVNELISLIDSTFVQYASICSVVGLWHPEDENETRLARNVKILASRKNIKYLGINSISSEKVNEYLKYLDA